MTARDPARKAARKPTNTAQVPQKRASTRANKPSDSGAKPEPKPVKVVRKGRRLSAGARLRRDLVWPKADSSALALVTQAARVADRLEVLDRLHSGDQSAWLAVKVDGQVAEVRLVGTVAEERQLSEVLRKLLADIGKLRAAGTGGKGDGGGKQDDPIARIVADVYGQRRG